MAFDYQSVDVRSFMNPIEASAIKKKMNILLSGKTCKIVDVISSKTGKHGHMKIVMTGLDIFTQSKVTYMCPGHQSLYLIDVTKQTCTVMAIDTSDGCLDVLDDAGQQHFVDVSASQLNAISQCKEPVGITLTTAVEATSNDAYQTVTRVTHFETILDD